MLEVEAKVAVDNLDEVRLRLRQLGAQPGTREVQEDTYFRHPARDFAATDEALRLRRTGDGLELTYKGPRQGGTRFRKAAMEARDGDTGWRPGAEGSPHRPEHAPHEQDTARAGDNKVREELTVRVVDDPTDFLHRLGCEAAFTVRKLREAWRLGELEVALDDVEGLGTFVEVEAIAVDAEAASRAVEETLAHLGLESAPREGRSYLELLIARRT